MSDKNENIELTLPELYLKAQTASESTLLERQKRPSTELRSLLSLLVISLQAVISQVTAGTQFLSHVTVNTPARSFTHGVGDPISYTGSTGRRLYQRIPQRNFWNKNNNNIRRPLHQQAEGGGGGGGYPRVKPSIPFNNEETFFDNTLNVFPWQKPNSLNSFKDTPIPVLPPSPYKVDSQDPESLWPEGLFIPPIRPHRFTSYDRSDTGLVETDPADPYLLEGSNAVAAVMRAKAHGLYYFHDIPHIPSLLANQELRIKNHLKPHRIASLRHTWPYYRP